MSHQPHSQFTDFDSSELNHHQTNGTYINNHQHCPTNGNGSIDYLQQSYKTIPSTQAIKGCHFDNQPQFPSPFCVYLPGGFQEIYNPHSGGTYSKDSQRFTCHVRNTHSIIQFPKVPRHDDIFCSQRSDNVLLLDIVSTESPRDDHSRSTFGSPRDRDLYRVHEGMTSLLQRMGDENLTFQEENKTATYYLPEEDIALHFTRVPRDGYIFCSQRNDNVVILEILTTEISQEHHNEYSCDRDLYKVYERFGEFLLVKMDNKNMPYGEALVFGGATQEENSTFTYYLPDKNLVCHFNRLPTHGDLFDSQRKNNIMILDIAPLDKYQVRRSYGSPWDADFYRVRQTDDGFELEMVTNSPVGVSAEDKIRRWLKIRRYFASNTSPDNVCAVCLAAYKDFDRIGSSECGHEYHVSCITPWLRQKGFCAMCITPWLRQNVFCPICK